MIRLIERGGTNIYGLHLPASNLKRPDMTNAVLLCVLASQEVSTMPSTVIQAD